MAYSPQGWEIVRAFYEQDLSLADIVARPEVKATGISDRGSICKKAKAQGWEKGKNATLATAEIEIKQAVVKIEEKKATLNATELRVHNSIVDETLRHIKFFNNAALKNVKASVDKITDETTQVEHKLIAETILKGRETVLGKTPDTVINNTNAQQNNIEPVKVMSLDDFYNANRPANT